LVQLPVVLFNPGSQVFSDSVVLRFGFDFWGKQNETSENFA